MHFTHIPACDRNNQGRVRAHHTWTDAVLAPKSTPSGSDPSVARRVRKAYRTMRAAGLTPGDARGILWDAFAAGVWGGKMADHDTRYS